MYLVKMAAGDVERSVESFSITITMTKMGSITLTKLYRTAKRNNEITGPNIIEY